MPDEFLYVVLPTEGNPSEPNALAFVRDIESDLVRLYVCGSQAQCLELLEACTATEPAHAEDARERITCSAMPPETDEADLQIDGWTADLLDQLARDHDGGYAHVPDDGEDGQGAFVLILPPEISRYAIVAWHEGPAAQVHLIPDKVRLRALLASLNRFATAEQANTNAVAVAASTLPEDEPSFEDATFGGQAALFITYLLLGRLSDPSKRASA